MTRPHRWLLSLVLLLAACNAEASGPLVPRPTPDVTTTFPVTTTTVDVASAALAEAVEAPPDCPTDFCVIHHLAPKATWSDGARVTAADFAYTAEVLGGLASDPVASPYPSVASVDAIDRRTVRVVFDEPYAGWQTMYERVYRAGRPAGSIAEIDTTGPFVFDEWAEGEYLTLERARDWWARRDPLAAGPLGDVQRLRFVFIESLEEMVDALEYGEVDVITARAELSAVERLEAMEGVDFAVEPGPYWEHIDFHHEDPMLGQSWVREAISLAIDRQEILDRTVRLLDPGATALDNTVWMAGTVRYEPHFDDAHDPDRAEEILDDHECASGSDGIRVCDGVRMSFRWASTDDDPARLEAFAAVREDLAEVGIEVVGEFRSPSDFVTREFLFGGPDQWQMINFSWRARQDPMAANPTYYCDDAGALNVNRYCSEDVERLIRETSSVADPDERAALYNEADALYLADRPLIPLYQKRTLMAWTDELDGPRPNYSLSGDLWNVASWSGKEEVIVALPSEPAVIDPRSQSDDSANVILGALLYGAYGMDPSHQQIPVLVDRVQLVTTPR